MSLINWPGITAAVSVLARSSSNAPRLIVPDIAHLDWKAFKANGVTGVVIDKDNCLTKPHDDALAPTLRPAWASLLSTFGPSNVLVVSNSAGTHKDSLLLQAESVSRNLGVPVLVHSTFKPGYYCARSIRAYFDPASNPPPSAIVRTIRRIAGRAREDPGAVIWARRPRPFPPHLTPPPTTSSNPSPRTLLVIGDRLTTDTVLAHRLSSLRTTSLFPSSRPPTPIRAIPILTTTLHGPEGLGTTVLRALEILVVRSQIRRRVAPLEGPWDACVLAPSPPRVETPVKAGGKWWSRLSLATWGKAKELVERMVAAWTLPPPPPYRNNTLDLSRRWREVMGYGSREGGWADELVRRAEGVVKKGKRWGVVKGLGAIPKMRQ